MESSGHRGRSKGSSLGRRNMNDEGYGKVLRTPGTRCCPLVAMWKGPFRGWLQGIDRVPGYLKRDREVVERLPEKVLRGGSQARGRAANPKTVQWLRRESVSAMTIRGSSPWIAGGRRALEAARLAALFRGRSHRSPHARSSRAAGASPSPISVSE